MQIQVETVYSLSVLTAMARALRKTLRRKKSRRTRIFSVVLMLIALLTIVLSLTTDPSFPAIISMAVLTLALLAVMIWEDQLNGYWARRQILAGTEVAQTTFTEDGYTTTTRTAKSEWRYEQIQCICQTSDYLILLLDANHAQVFDKHGFLAGNAEQLTALLMQKTGKDITSV